MNFKNITKIATVALLFASTSLFAVVSKGPLFLHIKNNTDYGFNIKQVGPTDIGSFLNDEIEAHQTKEFDRLPLSGAGEASFTFFVKDVSSNKYIWTHVVLANVKENFFSVLSMQFTPKLSTLLDLPALATRTDYEYHIFITLEGNKDNSFAGSSIRLEAGVPKA